MWRDPADGREWIYVGANNRSYDFAKVVRIPLDDPTVRELVWDRTLVSSDTFQVSADGRSAAGMFPWPDTGIAELPNKSWRKLGDAFPDVWVDRDRCPYPFRRAGRIGPPSVAE